jgi:molybdate transport system substrate-binding protein
LRSRLTALAAIVALAVSACAGSQASAARVDLTVYGASSLSSVLASVKATYESANPDTTLTISTDSSAALETKIEQGAGADVFLSADTANPQKLVDKGLASGELTRFAGNGLEVIVPKGNPAAIGSPADLARPGVKVIAAGDSVPITKYAAQLVASLARQPGYPADFTARYEANIVSRQDNVAAVVAQVGLGEGDAGIVYATDAKSFTTVVTVPLPTGTGVVVTYAGVVVRASGNAAAARAFLTWLAGPDGQAIVASFGFTGAP